MVKIWKCKIKSIYISLRNKHHKYLVEILAKWEFASFHFGKIFKGAAILDICRIPGYASDFRSSHQWCSVRKGFLRNFTKFRGKHLRQSLWHRCFPMNFVKFLRTPFSQNNYWRLLLWFVRNIQMSKGITIPLKKSE